MNSSLSKILFLIATIVCIQASHFRYGTIQWRANDPAIPNGIHFETITAYRRDYPYCVANVFQGSCVQNTNPNVGQYFVEGTFCFVNGGNCVPMWMLATAISTTDNWVIGNAFFNFNYPASDATYIVDHTLCCRISTLQNNRDQQWRIESRVTIFMSNPNTSPICGGLPIVPVPQQQAAVAYQIPANDNDNDAIAFTMASVAQLGGGAQSHPPGLAVTANGVVTLSTVSFVTGGLYTTQHIITDARGAYIPIDYIISVTLVKKTCDPACGLQPQQCFTPSDCGFCPDPDNTCVQGKPQVITTSTPPAPYSTPRTEPNGIVITVGVPTTFNLFFVAHDAQFTSPSKIVTIYNANIPPGASVSAQVPCNAASSCTCVGCNNPQIRVMTWTTTTADIGQNYPVCIGVRSSDNTELPNAQHCITVRVTGDPTTGTTGTTGTTSASTGTTRDPTTGTTTPPTSGTTGTTSARCPYDGLALKDVYLSDPEQMRTDHEVDSPFEDEFNEGRFELKLSQFFQSWLTRSHVTTLTGNPVRVGKYKARWDTIIEFIDLGAPGYFKGQDTIIQEYDLTTEELFWELPIVDIDSNNDWYAYLPDSSAPLVQIRGHVDVSQHVCVNYPLVPSPTSIFATIDFGSKWQRTDTKLALEMKYSYIEDLGSKKSVTLPAGTVEADLFGEFHPDGFPTTVSTSGGSVSVVTTTRDQRNGQASNKPEWDVWFAIDTTDHSPFTIELVTARHD